MNAMEITKRVRLTRRLFVYHNGPLALTTCFPSVGLLPHGFQMASNLHDLPDSPCIGVCSTLFDEVCKGCGRTAGEVANWVFMTDEEKRTVWGRIERDGTAMRFKYDKL
jgi:uncharacterized protein